MLGCVIRSWTLCDRREILHRSVINLASGRLWDSLNCAWHGVTALAGSPCCQRGSHEHSPKVQTLPTLQRSGTCPRTDVQLFSPAAVSCQGTFLPMVDRSHLRSTRETRVSLVGIRHHAGARSSADLANSSRLQHQSYPHIDQAARDSSRFGVCQTVSSRFSAEDARPSAQRKRSLSLLAARRRIRPKYHRADDGVVGNRVLPRQPGPTQTLRTSGGLEVLQRSDLCGAERSDHDRHAITPQNKGRIDHRQLYARGGMASQQSWVAMFSDNSTESSGGTVSQRQLGHHALAVQCVHKRHPPQVTSNQRQPQHADPASAVTACHPRCRSAVFKTWVACSHADRRVSM